jgi:hypothetical protein
MQSSSPSRFSPLLLDFGEYYFTNFSAHCFIFFHPPLKMHALEIRKNIALFLQNEDRL